MLFPTVTFAIFFAVVLPLSWWLMPRARPWHLFMLAASFFFYGWWDARFVLLLAGSCVVNQIIAVEIAARRDPRARKGLVALAVAVNLAVLGYFKYFGFFASSAQNTLNEFGLALDPGFASIVLPVGISFFTFQALSYVIDVYRGDFAPVGLLRFAVYLSFFPQLVAGPIVRPGELIPQMDSPRDPERVDASRAFALIVSGLFFKVVVANFLAEAIVDDVYGNPQQYSSLEVLVATYGYAVQIFADFLGYTNIAIGVALLLGFSLPTNFNAPYTATSIQDFWRRWHITLSRWLRDYLYIPLGGNRGGRWRTAANLMIVMLLGGLWHGAGWTFVVWGGIHGAALVAEHAWAWWRTDEGLPKPADTAVRRWTARIVTFNIVCLAWIFFRSESLTDAFDVLTQLFTAWDVPSALVTVPVLAAIAFGIGAQYIPRHVNAAAMAVFSRLPVPAQGAAVGVALTLIVTLGPSGVAPFIYFQF